MSALFGDELAALDDDAPRRPLRGRLAASVVLWGTDPHRALELALAERFDLVLSDIRMPGMDGVELSRRIRAARPALPIVLMTGFALESLVEEVLAEGIFAVLPKPFDVAAAIGALAAAARAPLVLVVDDAPAVAETTAHALTELGVRARAESDPARAIEVVRCDEIDVRVVDLVMPGIDGVALIDRVRTLGRRIAFIVVSGHEAPELVRRASAAGVRSFMRKPIPPRSLAREIARVRAGTLRAESGPR